MGNLFSVITGDDGPGIDVGVWVEMLSIFITMCRQEVTSDPDLQNEILAVMYHAWDGDLREVGFFMFSVSRLCLTLSILMCSSIVRFTKLLPFCSVLCCLLYSIPFVLCSKLSLCHALIC